MDPLDELLRWAEPKGVALNGIRPQRLPGRGVGVIATKALQPDEVVLEVPISCLRSIGTVPHSITRKLPKSLPIHGLLAADLALDSSPSEIYAPWNAVCPTPFDLSSMPLLWPSALQAYLPGTAKSILSKQRAKFVRDWAAVSAAFPDLDEETYRHAWLLVNTRTFYYLNPKLRRRRKEDRMVLQPVADLFNHAETGCNAAFSAVSFVVRADRAYEQGEEVRICYGRHGGDFLAVEYGFVMAENRWDEVGLDEVVMSRLSEKWRERLEEVSFLGGYVLDRETVCHRTQVALRALCCEIREWKRFVDGEDDGDGSQAKVDKLLVEMLEAYRVKIGEVVCEVQGLKEGEQEQRTMLVERWRQVDRLVEMSIMRLRSPRVENEAN
ncbi:SET domain-containing protein [Pseudomassariella vexata]|uniref:SET domain-containing protein n=1 Tax=Pseudomassariella vexata TaxID=1141098 RepID=A0A1Y2DN29_9PEZI|nr:SET domain-containing protein [Pseudomassariella vexata]ORY60546.1 SET domain-containing protein [Pseudomassariella vexata]